MSERALEDMENRAYLDAVLRGDPRLKDGRFISRSCPRCGYGELKREGDIWRCNGLLDPENDQAPLEACPVVLMNGELLGV